MSKTHTATLQDFWHGLDANGHVMFRVSGGCMAALDIHDGDTVEIDLDHMPKPPKYLKRDGETYTDACVCLASIPGHGERLPPVMMVKAYAGKFFSVHHVATCYAPDTLYKEDERGNVRMNCQFEPVAIFGVVCAVYDPAGRVRWQRDTSGHPTELAAISTIRGDNITYCSPVRHQAEVTE